MLPSFEPHHVMLSVRDLGESIEFYGLFGFEMVLRWTSKDGDLEIAHLTSASTLIELFAYEQNRESQPLQLHVGNHTERLGVRHFGLVTADLQAAQRFLVTRGIDVSAIQAGRTRLDFFYAKDPDGNWVEIVQDSRALSPGAPIVLREA